MKFPLESDPFAPVEVTPERIAELESLARVVVNETIAEWEHFVHVQNREVDKKRWKPTKTRENMTVYKDMHHAKSDPVPVYPGTPSTVGSDEANRGLRLLGVGSIVGSFDDFMLGNTTLTVDEMRIRRSYSDDECVDYRVLNVWRRPTIDEPFQFHCLRWYVKAVPGANAIVKPRDLVLLDCQGVMDMPDGERLGYFLLHSVEVPECREIPGIIRCQLAACYLFRPMGPNSVEVYLRSMVEPGGKIIDSVATISSTNALISTWKFPWVGQNKKLSWLMTQPTSVRSEMLGRKVGANSKPVRKDKCSLCTKSITLLRRTTACGLCLDTVCSRCVTVRKLSFIRRNGDLVQVPTTFCKNCIMWSTKHDAYDTARVLFVHEARGMQLATRNLSLGGRFSVLRDTTNTVDEDLAMLTEADLVGDADALHIETADEWERRQQLGRRYSSTQSISSSGSGNSQELMWQQMNQLVLAAEQTYQMTQQNSEVMVQSMQLPPRP
ncbi:hypothetical protein Poli38472_009903 [Pythium oligandrum]|uniref:START-like domain n=1 Tax=Pythium oligandrum TaxID=41045 RepID=A0A8K1C7Z3_PYTOL|nr:hypothetical protein Poli38472_009903 [Pythium oligandrum]|eukprot:TMW58344.1 hypothetical protein Poli38472_009903 [Pythium oligandrum]